MVWSLILKLKRRGSDIFSNDPYQHPWGGGGGGGGVVEAVLLFQMSATFFRWTLGISPRWSPNWISSVDPISCLCTATATSRDDVMVDPVSWASIPDWITEVNDFIGCDVVSAFRGRGGKSAWHTLGSSAQKCLLPSPDSWFMVIMYWQIGWSN